MFFDSVRWRFFFSWLIAGRASLQKSWFSSMSNREVVGFPSCFLLPPTENLIKQDHGIIDIEDDRKNEKKIQKRIK